jgi:uncharacterized protein YfaA (DUF2138 family)
MARRAETTHESPFTNATHPGTFAACAEYPCAPNRKATAYLRENDARTVVETVALDVLKKRAWTLWHAEDRDLGIVLVLSRAGLLRDVEHEKQQALSAHISASLAERDRAADGIAITHLDALTEQAADRLDAGDDPREVAAWMRRTREAISARRDHGRSSTTVEARS